MKGFTRRASDGYGLQWKIFRMVLSEVSRHRKAGNMQVVSRCCDSSADSGNPAKTVQTMLMCPSKFGFEIDTRSKGIVKE